MRCAVSQLFRNWRCKVSHHPNDILSLLYYCSVLYLCNIFYMYSRTVFLTFVVIFKHVTLTFNLLTTKITRKGRNSIQTYRWKTPKHNSSDHGWPYTASEPHVCGYISYTSLLTSHSNVDFGLPLLIMSWKQRSSIPQTNKLGWN